MWLAAGCVREGLKLEQVKLARPRDGGGAAGDAELAVDVVGVGLDRAEGDHERLGISALDLPSISSRSTSSSRLLSGSSRFWI